MADNRQYFYNGLTGELGLSPQQALGVMTSLAGESGPTLDPTSIGKGGDYGIAQWMGPRQVALKYMAQHQGLSPTDPAAQWGYMKAELTGQPGAVNYSNVLSQIKNASSASEANKIWTSSYEAPLVNNWQQRQQLQSQVGSVDAKGNFTLGSAKASPSSGAAPGASAATSSTGSTGPAGTTLNTTTPAAGALPGFPNKATSDQFVQGIKQMTGQPTDGESGGDQMPRPPPMPPAMPIRNQSPLLPMSAQLAQQLSGYSPQVYGHTLTSMQQPLAWSGASPGASPYANVGQQGGASGMSPQMQQMQQLLAPWALGEMNYGGA